jgi:hypothetical protein
VNDEEDTSPGVRPPDCWLCRRPYTSHAEDCTERNWQAMLKAHRAAEVRDAGAFLYFKALTRLQVLLDLGIGARSRGAWFHYKGKIV